MVILQKALLDPEDSEEKYHQAVEEACVGVSMTVADANMVIKGYVKEEKARLSAKILKRFS